MGEGKREKKENGGAGLVGFYFYKTSCALQIVHQITKQEWFTQFRANVSELT